MIPSLVPEKLHQQSLCMRRIAHNHNCNLKEERNMHIIEEEKSWYWIKVKKQIAGIRVQSILIGKMSA